MRASGIGLVLALFVMVLTVSTGAHAQSPSKQARRFAANNSLFVLYHELGHLLMDQLDLPVLGREEDAADNLATWTLLNKGTQAADRTLTDAARGWVLSGIAYGSELVDSDYYAAHTLDRQRAFQIVCLMVGSNDNAFKPLANQYAIDGDRQQSCLWDYDTVNRSFKKLLGTPPKHNRPSVVNVTYHDASGGLKLAADAFRASGVFEQVADEVRRKYSLPVPVAFNAQRCGEANAFYDPDTIEIIFCYELMQDYMDLYATDLPEVRVR